MIFLIPAQTDDKVDVSIPQTKAGILSCFWVLFELMAVNVLKSGLNFGPHNNHIFSAPRVIRTKGWLANIIGSGEFHFHFYKAACLKLLVFIFISARCTRAMGIWDHLRIGKNSGEILHLKPLSSWLQLSKCTLIRKHFEAQDALYITIIRLCHQYRLTVQFRMIRQSRVTADFRWQRQ
jgi:hypothetical protein